MKLLGNGLAHAMQLVTAARTDLLIVGKVILDTLARQVFRQGLAAALLSRRPFGRRQARVRQDNDIAIFAVGGVLIRSLFGFIEEAVNVLFALRRKTMQSCKRQLFLEFDDPFGELTVLPLQRSNARRQLFNSRFAGSIHQILESKACRGVNRSIREPSTDNLILPHRMADHRIDVDAIEDPVQLLGVSVTTAASRRGQRNLSSVSRFRTSTKPERSKIRSFIRSRRRLQNAKTAGANGSSAIVSWTRTARLLMPARKSIGSRCSRLSGQRPV
ncbi:hypothetical protein X734_31885 [Mesorhizobium sp. L2C084A000]|nr:hypothetical protein X734_31885 [Mesorhizobium sp. L2C084A000]